MPKRGPIVLPRNPEKRMLYLIKDRGPARAEVIRTSGPIGAGTPLVTAPAAPAAPTGIYVDSLSKSGDALLKGDVTLSEGDNITLTQVGNDIQVTSASAKTLHWSAPHLLLSSSGAHGGASTLTAHGMADTVASNAAGSAFSWATSPNADFTTGIAQQKLAITTSYRRDTNTLMLSSDWLLFAGFPKITSTVEVFILMKEPAAVSGVLASLSFHVTDGTNISSPAGSQFSLLDTSWRFFSSGIIDVTSYGNNLHWSLKVNGNNTDIGANINTTYTLDIHSIYVVFT